MSRIVETQNPEKLLEVSKLRVAFRTANTTIQAVRELSFDLYAGEILALVGESGSGKTVTGLCLNALLPHTAHVDAARLHFFSSASNWVDLRTDAAPLRGKEIGMIFQDAGTALNPIETCGSQIAELIQHHYTCSAGIALQQAKEWITKVGLPDPERIYRAYPHELSGGQKQRIMIAMAMCINPRLLIADEPTTALDRTIQKQILNLMRTLCRASNTAMLFISHDLNLVFDLADRILVMREGEVLETNTAQQILNHPAHPYTAALLACRPTFKTRQHRLPLPEASAVDQFKKENPAQPLEEVPHNPKHASLPCLEVDALSVRFSVRRTRFFEQKKWVQAVDQVSFSLQTGQTLGIAGESGSGKTTLARALMGLVQPHSGSICLDGEALLHADTARWRQLRRSMQLVFQDPFSALNPRITVGEAILEPLRYHQIGINEAERLERVETILRRVGLGMECLNRFPHAFSGGQRQRIGIARALVLNPRILICDESVASLDVSIQAQTLNLLKDLQDEFALTYLFISHDLPVIRFMSDQVLIMQSGKIVESGDAEAVLLNPQHPYTQELLEAMPMFV